MGQTTPIWLETVVNKYPPVTFTEPEYMKKRGKKMPKPPKIEYSEDKFRRRFFRENPSKVLQVSRIDEASPTLGPELYS